jgi:D-arabinose 1-dehydrogenase-like Zn-dependent alcohol dehydrogenase
MDLLGGRRHLMGSPSGSRKDIRATLDFSAHHRVLPHITKFSLEEAGKALELMHRGKLSGRAVLMLR